MAYIDIPHKDNTTPLTPTEWNYLVDKLNARRIRDIIDVEDADPVTGDMLQHNGSGWIYWDITGEYYNKDEIDAILVGDADVVGSTVQSLSIDYSTGVLTLKQENAPDRDVILSWFALDQKAQFSGGAWTSSAYKKNTFTREGDWLGIALVDTSEHLAPQKFGDPYYTYSGDAISEGNVVAKNALVGLRATSVNGVYVEGYSMYMYAGQKYTFYSVLNPGVDEIVNQILSIDAIATGRVEFALSPVLVPAGTTIDFACRIEASDPVLTTTLANYNYTTPNNSANANAGQIVHANKSLDLISVSKFDSDGTDRTILLESIVDGDRISVGGLTWTVSGINVQASFVNFDVTPAQQYGTDGIAEFSFSIMPDSSIDFIEDTDYYLPDNRIQGFQTVDGGYDDIVLDETFYGVDLKIQEATISDDWFILAVTGATGAAGDDGGTSIDIIDNLTTPRTDAALSANMGVYIQSLLDLKANIDHTLDSHSDVSVPTPLNGQLLTYDDETLSWVGRYSYAGLGFVELNYRYATDDSTPNSGYVSTDNDTDPSAVTTLYMNKESASGNDLSPYLVEIKYGDWLNYHLYDDFDSHQKYDVLGPAVLVGNVFEIPVSLYVVTGTTLQNNDKLGVLWRIRSAPVGLGTDDVMNQSTLPGTSATDALNSLNANKQENSIPITIVDYPYVPVIEHNAHYIKAQNGCELITLSQQDLPIGFNQIVFNDSLSDVVIESGDTIEGINEPIPPGQQGYYVITEANTWSVTTPVNLEWILPRDIQIVKPTADYTTQTDESGFYVMAQNGCSKILLNSTDKTNGYNQIVYNQSDSDVVFESSVGSIDGENNPIPPDGQGHYVLNSGVWTVTTPIPLFIADVDAPTFAGELRVDYYDWAHFHNNKTALDRISHEDIDNWNDGSIEDTEAPTFPGELRVDYDDWAHYHNNKSTLDGIGSDDISNWNEAYESIGEGSEDTEAPTWSGELRVDYYDWAHTHSNKYILDTITFERMDNWDTAYSWGDHADAGYYSISNPPPSSGPGEDTEAPTFAGQLYVDRNDEYALKTEDNDFRIHQSFNSLYAYQIETSGVTISGFTDTVVMQRSAMPDIFSSNGDYGIFYRGSVQASHMPNNNDIYADLQAVWDINQTGVDYVAPVISLNSEGKSNVHLVGASAVDGGVSFINSRFQIGFNQWSPTLGNTRMLAINGDVGAAGFYQDSLASLKENITPFTKSGLDIISSLDIVNYDYIDGEDNQIGIIIDDSPDEVANNDHDAVDLMKMVAVLAKANQELLHRVRTLERKIFKRGV